MSFLGVLMLQTRFPRLPGDVGDAGSFAMPVRHFVVAGATPQRVVRGHDPTLLAPFILAARALVGQGAGALTTSCGFLVLFQQALEEALTVPVWTSSLLKLRELARPGVLTVDAQALGAAHLHAAGAAPDTPIEGLEPGCALQRTLLENLPSSARCSRTCRRWTRHRPRPMPWQPHAAWSSGTLQSTASCSSAPTCRPMPPRSRAPPGALSTT